jgi:hypothetical protein
MDQHSEEACTHAVALACGRRSVIPRQLMMQRGPMVSWHVRIEPFKFITHSLLSCLFMMLATPALSQIFQGGDRLPVLYGIKFNDTQIVIDVVSFGCTNASYFLVQLDSASPDTYRLSIIQSRQDRCRIAAHIITLTLDTPAIPNLTDVNFLLMNRLRAPVTLPRSDP